jgi:BirA family biotin operon repressor/biotin-[acetyl-CoA-carboxylase] ligase
VGERIAFDLIPSTQDEAVRRIRAGGEVGLTVVAHRQHRGRGRLDHTWVSPSGGLYLSTAVAEPRFEPGLVPVGVGAGISKALDERFSIHSVLKWPNDVLARASGQPPRKLAGVLVDRVLSPTFGVALVVGIGLNASMSRSDFPAELAGRVAILSELCDRRIEPAEVEPIVSSVIAQTVGLLDTPEGRSKLWENCRSSLYGIGRTVRVDGRPAGVIRDLAEDGSLLVERAGEVETVRSGEVEVEVEIEGVA